MLVGLLNLLASSTKSRNVIEDNLFEISSSSLFHTKFSIAFSIASEEFNTVASVLSKRLNSIAPIISFAVMLSTDLASWYPP